LAFQDRDIIIAAPFIMKGLKLTA